MRPCSGDVIGSHRRLKISRLVRAGSSPAPSTNLYVDENRWLSVQKVVQLVVGIHANKRPETVLPRLPFLTKSVCSVWHQLTDYAAPTIL